MNDTTSKNIEVRKAIVLGGMSDIAQEIIKELFSSGWNITATYSNTCPKDESMDINWLRLTLVDGDIKASIKELSKKAYNWSLFISCIGTQEPVGMMVDIDVMEWIRGVNINGPYQIAMLLGMLPYRDKLKECSALFFAGGGTNNATPYYSAQTLGKINLIKAVELLDNEIGDVKCIVLGPGWVKTKIHQATLDAGPELTGRNYFKTKDVMNGKIHVNSITKVVNDVMLLLDLPRCLVGGRNFSSVHDDISLDSLTQLHIRNPEFYRLKRLMNTSNDKHLQQSAINRLIHYIWKKILGIGDSIRSSL